MSDDDVLNTKDNNTSQKTKGKGNSDEKSREERIKAIINELNDLIDDIKNSRQVNDVIFQTQGLNLNQEATPGQTITNDETPAQNQGTSTDQGTTQNQTTPTTQSQSSNTTNVTVNATLVQTAQTLVALNSIRTELCRLPLNFCEREYIANCVTPLESAMEFVSRSGFELATSASILTTSPIVPRKKEKIKDVIHTVYSMNEEVLDIYNILKHRLRKIIEEDNCCTLL